MEKVFSEQFLTLPRLSELPGIHNTQHKAPTGQADHHLFFLLSGPSTSSYSSVHRKLHQK